MLCYVMLCNVAGGEENRFPHEDVAARAVLPLPRDHHVPRSAGLAVLSAPQVHTLYTTHTYIQYLPIIVIVIIVISQIHCPLEEVL